MAQSYPALWFTSGTPIRLGQQTCEMARFLEYHAGVQGVGFRKKAQAVPLATGAGVHTGLELVGGWILDWQTGHPGQRLLQVPDEVVAWGAIEAAERYEAKALAKGLELTKTDVDAAAAVKQLILEQKTLIEAQVWIYCLGRLPFMLSQARLLDVEREEGPVLDCTCGLGDWVGTWQQHGARGCQGIVAQGRADFLWEMVDGGAIVYEEFKTKATSNYGWDQGWEHSGQLRMNMESASRRLGKDVATAYVPVLYKGRRDRIDREEKTLPKIQQSPLVYGWFDPGAPPLRPADWASRYKWFDDWGKGHTLPRTYRRQLVSAEDVELPSENPNAVTFRADASRVERWVRGWILPIQYPELLKVLGPFPKPRALMQDAVNALVINERRWRDDVAHVRSLGLFQPGDVHVTADGQRLDLSHFIVRSWACTGFDGTPCQFKPVCHKEPGWEQIEALDRYEIRTPHHQQEREAFESCGIVFPASGDEDEDGGEE